MTESHDIAATSIYRRLAGYARPYAWRLSVGILAGFLAGGSWFGVLKVIPSAVSPFQQQATATEQVREAGQGSSAVPADETDMILGLAERFGVQARMEDGRMARGFMLLVLLGLSVFIILQSIGMFLNRYYMRWIGSRIVRDLRDELFSHLQRQSLVFYGRSDVGKLISRCTNDATVVETMIAATVADATRAPFEILAAISYVVYYSIQREMLGLVLLVALIFPLCIVPIVILGRYVRRYTRRALERVSDLVSRMHENFTGIRVVKAFNMEEHEFARFQTMNARYFRSIIKALKAELFMSPFTRAVAIVLGGAFLVVCYMCGATLVEIMPLGLAAIIAYQPIKKLAKVNAGLQRGAAALARIFEILDSNHVLVEAGNPVVVTGFHKAAAFENVTFSYQPGSTPVLSDVSFEIPKGSVVALVGETGSGKTTLANLLARFYDPTSGSVVLDGIDLREIEIASLRRLIGIVTQETILFNDTIAGNISYGTSDADREQIITAAKKANAHDFIMAEPEGYDRIVGEKGFVLSGGEKQRIAIARAILKDPPVLILDEATSALDTVTERLVQEAIARVMKDRTVFAIAHRLSTVKHADQILLIEKGRIAERGTHEELYKAHGRYRNLCDMQVLDE